MKHGFMMGTAAFILLAATVLAHAQTSTYSTTTTTTAVAPVGVSDPAPVTSPPVGTLSTTESQKSVDAYGNEVDTTKTTYGNVNGAASDATSTTTIQPPPVETTVTKKVITTSTSN